MKVTIIAALLAATDGAWVFLKSDGTNWQIMASGI